MSEDKMIFNLDFGKYSAAGINKLSNEDAVGYFIPQRAEDLYLRGQMFIVVDGAGEKQDGEFASKLVIQTVLQAYYETPWSGNLIGMLTSAINKANSSLYHANINKGKQTYYSNSIMCAVAHDNSLLLAAAGSCVAYLLSNNSLEKLMPFAARTEEPASLLPDTQAEPITLGLKDKIEIAVHERQIQMNDAVLLFTKSIVESIRLDELPSIISTSSLNETCEWIVKMAVNKKVDDDATALIFKAKGIRRLSIDDIEQPVEPRQEIEKPAESETVIKGMRYRSSRADEEMGNEDFHSVDEFTHDRDVRRQVHKRTMPPAEKSPIKPKGKLLNYAILILFAFLILYAGIKYLPSFFESLGQSPVQQTITPADTLDYDYAQPPEAEDVEKDLAEAEPQQEATKAPPMLTEHEPPLETATSVSIKIAVVDGSKKQLPLSTFTKEIGQFYSADRLTPVSSSYRINNSAIIWRKSADQQEKEEIKKRVEKIQHWFNQNFKLKPDSFPLDFSIVIGADFKLPQIADNYSNVADRENDYYVEILNGYKTPGVARKLQNQLHHQRYKGNKIIVVNIRNADKQNYLQSFIKCESAKTELAKNFAAQFKLPKMITNAPLFDIKILLGADIQL